MPPNWRSKLKYNSTVFLSTAILPLFKCQFLDIPLNKYGWVLPTILSEVTPLYDPSIEYYIA
jgi:hypothetical protein